MAINSKWLATSSNSMSDKPISEIEKYQNTIEDNDLLLISKSADNTADGIFTSYSIPLSSITQRIIDGLNDRILLKDNLTCETWSLCVEYEYGREESVNKNIILSSI